VDILAEEHMENVPDIQENKLLKLIQSKHADFHPILVLAEIAADASLRITDPAIVTNAAKAMLPFIEPSLKAIEVRGNVRNDFGILRVSMMDESAGEGEIIS
jgi:hypothetical protein